MALLPQQFEKVFRSDHIHLAVHVFLELLTLDQRSVAVPEDEVFFRMLLDKKLQLLISDTEILRCLIQC